MPTSAAAVCRYPPIHSSAGDSGSSPAKKHILAALDHGHWTLTFPQRLKIQRIVWSGTHVFLEPAVQLDLFLPEHARPELNHSYIAPRNPTERTLADIWQQLLGLEQVGIHDDFFDLGGHSLLAIQIISRVRNTFRVYLPVDALFENPTIAGLAAQITDALTNAIVVSDDAADMLADLKGLSDEEAERLLGQEISNRI